MVAQTVQFRSYHGCRPIPNHPHDMLLQAWRSKRRQIRGFHVFRCLHRLHRLHHDWLTLPPRLIYWRDVSGALLRGPIKLPECREWMCVALVASNVVLLYCLWQLDALNALIRRGFRMRRIWIGKSCIIGLRRRWRIRTRRRG